MTRLKVLFPALLIALAALAIACGDDDDASTSTSAPTDGATVTASPDDGAETPTGDGDETTPPDEKTPIGGDGNGGHTTAPTSNATPAAEGIRAVQQSNYPEWLAENHPDVSPVEAPCAYNPATVTATCDGEDYAVDPPLTGEDISCFTQNVNSEPVAIRCTSQSPLTTIYYVIQS
jgi:hypothetical protein